MAEGTPRGRRPANTPTEDVVDPEETVKTVPEDTVVPEEPNSALAEALAELKAMKQQIADLQTQAARPVPPTANNSMNKKKYTKAAPGEKYLIHFIRDGLMLPPGKPRFTGDVLRIDPNSEAYKGTEDIYGFSVLELRNDAVAQERVLGAEYFREGPWTGGSYADITFETLKALAGEEEIQMPTKQELESLEAHERSRIRDLESLTPVRGAARPVNY